jgi:tetratricopeptide (TPR) repeat protein
MTLTSGVSDRERLFIEALSADAAGDEDKFIALHEVLVRTYPNDQVFHSNLAGRYTRRGEWQKALTEAEASIRLSPKRPAGYQLAANVLVEMERLEDAKKILHGAIDAGLDRPDMHRSLLYIATAEGDAAAQTKELAWFKSPDAPALRHVANGAAALGQLRKAEEYYRRAQQALGPPGTPSSSGQFMQQLAITAAVLGACDVPSLRDVPKPPPVAAFCGGPAAMASVSAKLRSQTGPQAYMRGLVLLHEGHHTEAEALFTDMLRRKVANWGPEYPAALVGLARAAKASGNIAKAKTTYEQFFAFWKDADEDVPLLVLARKEFAELPVSQP